VAALLATAVVAVDAAGWLQWKTTTRTISRDADRGASVLARDWFVALPSFHQRARRLAVRDLGTATRQQLVEGLARLGRLQASWMPADPAGFTHLSHSALLGDQPAEALRRLGQALDRDPLSPSLRRLRAMVLKYLGALDAALEDLALAQALAPRLSTPEVELTPEDTREVQRMGLELRSSLYPRRRVEATLALARFLRDEGDLDEAWKVLLKSPHQPEIQIERAAWLLEDGEPSTAAPLLIEVAENGAYPRRIRARAWSLLAMARDQLGDGSGAVAAAEAVLALRSRSPDPYVTLARLALRRGDTELALVHLRRAWGMAPHDVRVLRQFAEVAVRAGRQADAKLALQRALEVEPDDPAHAIALARFELDHGDPAEAAMVISRGLDRFPTDAGLLRLADRLRRDVGAATGSKDLD
jgi:Tfp pilus assembly protein PilF